MESYFQKIPSEELIENKQQPAGSDKKKDLDQAEKAGKEEE